MEINKLTIYKNKTIFLMIALLLLGISLVSAASTITETESSLKINSLRYEPYPVEPGQYFKLWIKVENSGVEKANDVSFELIPEYPFSIDSNENALRSIGQLKIGDEVVLEYKIKVDPNAVSGENDLKFRYTTDSRTGPWVTTTEKVSVQTHDAVLAVENVETTPTTIAPGQTAHLKLTFENLADSLLKDVRVNLELYRAIPTTASVTFIELPFTPFGSSNTKTVSSIAPHETKDIEFDLITDADAKAKIYKLPITVTYSDVSGKNYSRSYITALVVSSPPDLSIGIDSTTLTKEQKSGNVVIKFVNKGATDIKFLNVILKPSEDYTIISSNEVYVGSVDSDDYQTAEFTINMKKELKQLNLPISIAFKDGVNKDFSEDVNVQLNLFSNSELGKGSNGTFSTILIIIIIAAVGFFIYRKFKKKKK